MQRSSVRDLVAEIRPRYRQAGRGAKGRILEEFCAVTGYHRVYARRVLGRAGPGRAEPPTLVPVGPQLAGAAEAAGTAEPAGTAERGLLVACWELTDRICSKRLAPFLEELVTLLAAREALPAEASPEVVARVVRLSPRTIDRWLAAQRRAWPRRGLATTKPGTLLRQQVPIRTFAQWDQAGPGFLEVDLVAHSGASGAGQFAFTVSGVDVATGWIALEAVRNKSEYEVFRALQRLRERLPVPLRGLDSDNGGEFINHNLVAYCQQERITLTRSRPYRKQDSCHVEQKNWSVVRRLVGYARFEGYEAVSALSALYDLARDYVNFCQPVLKQRERVRSGARVTVRYDRAQTPYRRLLATSVLEPARQAALAERYAQLHPVRLKLALEAAQQTLYRHAAGEPSPMAQRIGPENFS